MKKYVVEISNGHSYGCYGKKKYFNIIAYGKNKKDAELQVQDNLYNMSFEEFFNSCIDDYYATSETQNIFMRETQNIKIDNHYRMITYQYSLKDKIPLSYQFTCKAKLIKE